MAVTILAWTRDGSNSAMPPLNLGTQYSTAYGSLAGPVDGTNATFTLVRNALVTQVVVFLNGNFQSEGTDYSWECAWTSSAGPWRTTITMAAIPSIGDLLTAQVFGE